MSSVSDAPFCPATKVVWASCACETAIQCPLVCAAAATLKCPLAAAVLSYGRGMSDHDGDRLDAAADQFEQLGAFAMAADASAHAAREHARAGTRIRELESSTRAHWLASRWGLRTPATNAIDSPLPITDREREIANLVAVGLTNREVADRLYLSPYTVNSHLRHVFTKLGIRSRVELARLTAERGTPAERG